VCTPSRIAPPIRLQQVCVCTCVCLHPLPAACIYMCVCVCLNLGVCVCACVCARVRVCVCAMSCVCLCVCVRVRLRVRLRGCVGGNWCARSMTLLARAWQQQTQKRALGAKHAFSCEQAKEGMWKSITQLNSMMAPILSSCFRVESAAPAALLAAAHGLFSAGCTQMLFLLPVAIGGGNFFSSGIDASLLVVATTLQGALLWRCHLRQVL